MRKLFTRHSHKKASLEISVQAIVIVVLAMTLLGLGLGFVRNLFQDTTDLTTQVTDQIKGQILEDLRRGDKSLSFPTDQVSLGKGEEKILAIGIKNIGQFPLQFKIEIWEIDEFGAEVAVDPDYGEFLFASGALNLKVTEASVYPIKFSATTDATGTKIYLIKVMDQSDLTTPYASKTFFIKVT